MNKLFTLKKIIGATILAVSLPLATVAIAHEHDAHGPYGKAAHCERGGEKGGKAHGGMHSHLRGLDLTETQKDQIFKIHHEQAPQAREQNKERFKLWQELRATTQAEKFDDAKAQQLAEKIAVLDKERTLRHARNEAKVNAILTPEQRAKAKEFKEHRRHGHGERAHGEKTRFKSHRHANKPQAI